MREAAESLPKAEGTYKGKHVGDFLVANTKVPQVDPAIGVEGIIQLLGDCPLLRLGSTGVEKRRKGDDGKICRLGHFGKSEAELRFEQGERAGSYLTQAFSRSTRRINAIGGRHARVVPSKVGSLVEFDAGYRTSTPAYHRPFAHLCLAIRPHSTYLIARSYNRSLSQHHAPHPQSLLPYLMILRSRPFRKRVSGPRAVEQVPGMATLI